MRYTFLLWLLVNGFLAPFAVADQRAIGISKRISTESGLKADISYEKITETSQDPTAINAMRFYVYTKSEINDLTLKLVESAKPVAYVVVRNVTAVKLDLSQRRLLAGLFDKYPHADFAEESVRKITVDRNQPIELAKHLQQSEYLDEGPISVTLEFHHTDGTQTNYALGNIFKFDGK